MLRKIVLTAVFALLVSLTGSARADNGTFKVKAPEAGAAPELLATAGKLTVKAGVEELPAMEATCRRGWGGGYRGYYGGHYGYSSYCYYPSYSYSSCYYPSYYYSNCYYQPYYYSCYQPCYYYYSCSAKVGSLSVCDLPSNDARGQIKRSETKMSLPVSMLKAVQ